MVEPSFEDRLNLYRVALYHVPVQDIPQLTCRYFSPGEIAKRGEIFVAAYNRIVSGIIHGFDRGMVSRHAAELMRN